MLRDEIQNVALGLGVNYEGLFNYSDLIASIDSFFRKKGYTKHVMNHEEKVKEKGREVNWRLRPFRMAKSNKLEIQVWMSITDMVDTVKEVDGKKLNLNKGKIKISIDCFVLSDMRGKWEARAEYTFIRTIFDKYLFRSKSKDFEGMVKSDAVELQNELRSYLNLTKFLF